MAELNWTDAQWQKVNDAVKEAFGKASVASAFLPCYGPLAGSAETVRNERLKETAQTITLDVDHSAVNLKLVNLTVKVELSSEQVAEESLSNALLAFRRAANILAQEEDLVVFAGYDRGEPDENSEFVANKIAPQKGLADLFARRTFGNLDDILANRALPPVGPPPGTPLGQAIVSAVVDSVGALEGQQHPGPFACVLGDRFFNAVHDPSDSMVLPADRIGPQLKGGPLLRSSKINTNTGIVVSLAAGAVDIVVGTPPTVQFLQRTASAKYLFRVYERFAMRLRDKVKMPVSGFTIRTSENLVAQTERLEELVGKITEIPTLKYETAELDKLLAIIESEPGTASQLDGFRERLNAALKSLKALDLGLSSEVSLDPLIGALAYLLVELETISNGAARPANFDQRLTDVEDLLAEF